MITLLYLTIILIIFVQIYVLYTLNKMMMRLDTFTDCFLQYLHRVVKSPAPHAGADKPDGTCQFCKHRLSYIQPGEGDKKQEDFYYRCQLSNREVDLNDSCEFFQIERSSA